MIFCYCRIFFVQVVGLCVVFVVGMCVFVVVLLVDENDVMVKMFGYCVKVMIVDVGKFLKYQVGQMCVNCCFYKVVVGEFLGMCLMFVGKMVVVEGWCNVYVKFV